MPDPFSSVAGITVLVIRRRVQFTFRNLPNYQFRLVSLKGFILKVGLHPHPWALVNRYRDIKQIALQCITKAIWVARSFIGVTATDDGDTDIVTGRQPAQLDAGGAHGAGC